MRKFLCLPLLVASAAAAQPAAKVEVATGDWSGLPALKLNGYDHLSSAVMSKVYEIGRSKNCRLPGQSGHKLDLSVSFAAKFSSNGKLERLILPQLNCPEAESWLGGTLLKSVQHGDFVPTGESPEGWYRGDLSFYYEG